MILATEMQEGSGHAPREMIDANLVRFNVLFKNVLLSTIKNIDYCYTPGFTFAIGILNKNRIGHLLRTLRNYFRPFPQSFRKEIDTIYVLFEEYLLSLSYF